MAVLSLKGELELRLAAADARLLLLFRPAFDDSLAAVVAASTKDRVMKAVDRGYSEMHQCRTNIMAIGEEQVELIDALDFAVQLLRGNPRWTSALLPPGNAETLYVSESMKALISCDLVGAPFVKSCTHQACARVRELLRIDRTAHGGDEAAACAAWRLAADLFTIGARAAGGAGADDEPVPASLLEDACARPLDVGRTQMAYQWQAICERQVALVNEAMQSTEPLWHERCVVTLETWLEALPEAGTACEAQVAASVPAHPLPSTALNELMVALASPVPDAHVIHAVQSGSRMYNLQVRSSDTDYHLVYMQPSSRMLSLREASSHRKLHFSRSVGAPYGAAKEGVLEYTAVELSHFVRTLSKGNPSAVELLFVSEQSLASAWPWDELVAMRQHFMTEVSFTQYVGFIKTHLHRAAAFLPASAPGRADDGAKPGAHGDSSGEASDVGGGEASLSVDEEKALSKALYHTFHKLFEARRMLQGEPLHVALRGEELAFVRSIRSERLVGDRSPTALLARARALLAQLQQDHVSRAEPLPPTVDQAMLKEWLCSVRIRDLERSRPMANDAHDAASCASSSAASYPLPSPPPPSRASSHMEAPSTRMASMHMAEALSIGPTEETEAVSADDRERVSALLGKLEADHAVQVLWATERSSRTFGTHHSRSDFDVIAVFAPPLEELLSLRPPRKSLTVTTESDSHAPITITAYEARHACSMLAANNPTMYECVQSQHVHWARGSWLADARAMVDAQLDAPSLQRAYRRLARSDFNKYVLQRGTAAAERRVKGKKTLHAVREWLTAEWLERHALDEAPSACLEADRASTSTGSVAEGRSTRAWPPLQLNLLVAAEWVSDAARGAVVGMLTPEARDSLVTPREPNGALEQWLKGELRRDGGAGTWASKSADEGGEGSQKASLMAWDAFCTRMLKACAVVCAPVARGQHVAPHAAPTIDEIGLRYAAPPAKPWRGDKYFGGDKTSSGLGYTSLYETLLQPFRHAPNVHLVEIGVWYGKSLAMWCDFFDDGSAHGSCTVHGIDCDLRRSKEHCVELEAKGAFRRNQYITYQYDTRTEAFTAFVGTQLPAPTIVVDDGCHTAESQWAMFKLLFPRLQGGGIYIIEDVEQPAAFFALRATCCFGAVLGAVSNVSYLSSEQVQSAAARAESEADALVCSAQERAVHGREAVACQLEKLDGKGAREVVEKLEGVLEAKDRELALLSLDLDARRRAARREAHKAFDAEMVVAGNLASAVASIEVRKKHVVVKKHATV